MRCGTYPIGFEAVEKILNTGVIAQLGEQQTEDPKYSSAGI
jgi:hypothetical protein